MDTLEDGIDGFVPAPPFPPTFDDTAVVAVDLVAAAVIADCEQSADKKFEADGFSPSNISTFLIPARDETPGLPPSLDDDADANSRAGIQKGVAVGNLTWARDRPREVGG